MSVEFLLVVGATVGVAAFVQGVIGFGFGMVSMSVIPMYLDVQVAVPIVAFFGVCMNAYLLAGLRKYIRLGNVGPMLAGGAIGAPVGVMLLREVDARYMKLALGIIILGYCANALRPKRTDADGASDIHPVWGGVFGAFGGLLQGGLNTGGPPVVIYATLKPWDKDTIKATLLTFFWVIAVAQTIYFVSSGMFAGDALKSSLALLPALFIGVIIGTKVYDRINHERFRIIVLVFLAIMGVNFVVRSLI